MDYLPLAGLAIALIALVLALSARERRWVPGFIPAERKKAVVTGKHAMKHRRPCPPQSDNRKGGSYPLLKNLGVAVDVVFRAKPSDKKPQYALTLIEPTHLIEIGFLLQRHQ